jgi:hypothetical protein
MLYLIYAKIPAGACTDLEEGGPEKIMGDIFTRLKPKSAYVEAGKRDLLMVADLDETQTAELTIGVSKQMGTCPKFVPLIPVAGIPEMAGKAIEEVTKST